MKEEKVLKAKINAKGMQISVVSDGSYDDYISLTDIAKYKSEDPAATIQNWLRSRDVIEFLGLWETLHNPDFKPLEFEGFRKQAGANAFTMSPKKWIETTDDRNTEVMWLFYILYTISPTPNPFSVFY